MATKSLICMILFSLSCGSLFGATGAIGTVSARGEMQVNGSTIWGDGTLFDGTTIETSAATVDLRLEGGTQIRMAADSRGVVYRDHLVLLRGKTQMKTSGASYFLEAAGLRVVPGESNALGVVSLGNSDAVEVAAVTGNFRIVDDTDLALAHVAPGAAFSFRADQGPTTPQQGAPPSFLTKVAGLVSSDRGSYYFTTDGIKYSLVTGRELKKFVGKKVILSGFLQAPAAAGGLNEILVTEIQINGGAGMTTGTKVLIGAAVAGGAAGAAIGASSGSKSPASP